MKRLVKDFYEDKIQTIRLLNKFEKVLCQKLIKYNIEDNEIMHRKHWLVWFDCKLRLKILWGQDAYKYFWDVMNKYPFDHPIRTIYIPVGYKLLYDNGLI